jgi:hypothetical protein
MQMRKLIGLLSVLMLCAGTAQGLGFENGGEYNPSRHDRFLPGTFPDAPVPNPEFILAPYEDQLRGVGWQTSNPKKKVALISPQHFVTANHHKATGSISFLDVTGTVQTFAVTKVVQIAGDIAIGTLETHIPDPIVGIKPFPVANVKGDGPKGREVYYVGNAPKSAAFAVGITGFSRSLNGQAYLNSELFKKSGGHRDRVLGISGDSGSPSFFLTGGKLVLIGHHYSAQRDYILGLQAQAANAHMASSGYSLNLLAAPSGCGDGAAQGAVATLAVVGWRRKKKVFSR